MTPEKQIVTGNIIIFHAYDIGDDINLDAIKDKQLLLRRPLQLAKYFKSYHTPLEVELPHPHSSSRIMSVKIHAFGVITLTYKIAFSQTLDELKQEIDEIDDEFSEQSVIDAGAIFNKIKSEVKQPKFFHLRKSYVLIQANPSAEIGIEKLKDEFGSSIASMLRFETDALSEYQKNEILASSVGYYRGNLVVIDTYATFIYDEDYEEILDLFEFANMQHLELQYFDRLLSQQLIVVYERGMQKVPLRSFLPFISDIADDPIAALGKLKVDISVITERLENSIKLSGEEYYSDIYGHLVEKFEINNWQTAINRKLNIIFDLRSVYEDKVNMVRQDLLTVLIIALIFIEMIFGILTYFK
jgi:hypothetical protein